jgi:predicted PurR-regulated permease PerM
VTPDRVFAKRLRLATAVVLGVSAAVALLSIHPEIPLLAFAGCIGAVLLDGMARPCAERLHLPREAAVIGCALLGLAALGLALALEGPLLVSQAGELLARLPDLLSGVRHQLSGNAVGQEVLTAVKGTGGSRSMASYAFGSLAGLFSTAVGMATGLFTVVALSLFLALQPERYLGALLQLLPPERRARAREIGGQIGRAIRWWMAGRVVAMVIVALLTLAGLIALGIALPVALALLAGVFTFVPYLGPVLAAVPAIAVAAPAGLQGVVGVVALYSAVQLLENYLVTPVVQGNAVSLPPAILLLAQLLLGVMLGFLGLLLATPLAVGIGVLVQTLYVEDALREEVRVLGDHG